MSFKLLEISNLSEFTNHVSAFWSSYNDPPQPAFHCAAPITSTLSAALSDLINRFSTSLKEDPTIHYFSVIDTSSPDNKVIGGGSWNIFLEDPYANESKNDRGIYWWPEGSDSKKFTERMFMGRVGLRLQRHRRPHVLLNTCFTIPEYRNRGVASLVMDWGVKKADELGLNMFIEAGEQGRHLYAKFGFIEIDKSEVDMVVPNPSEEWKEMERKNLPFGWVNMWRPVGGKYTDGMKYPWEEE